MFTFDVSTLLGFHNAVSVAAIPLGLIVCWGFLNARAFPLITLLFLAALVATSVTGFLFPFTDFGPAHIIGAVSLVVLFVALLGRYVFRLRGPWRPVYVIAAVLALWLNVFVAIVQAFQKIPELNFFAPTGTELPFAIVQGVAFLAFGWVAVQGAQRFHP